MKKLIALLLSVLLITACLAACGSKTDTPDTPADDSGKLNVVCSIFPQYDFIKAIAGDEVNLTLLLDSKTDLHSYTPTADDIMTISKADLFINIGGESDDWAEDVLSSAANDKLHVVSLLKLVDAVEEETLPGMQEEEEHEEAEHEEDGPEYDEHVWTSLHHRQRRAQNAFVCRPLPVPLPRRRLRSDLLRRVFRLLGRNRSEL